MNRRMLHSHTPASPWASQTVLRACRLHCLWRTPYLSGLRRWSSAWKSSCLSLGSSNHKERPREGGGAGWSLLSHSLLLQMSAATVMASNKAGWEVFFPFLFLPWLGFSRSRGERGVWRNVEPPSQWGWLSPFWCPLSPWSSVLWLNSNRISNASYNCMCQVLYTLPGRLLTSLRRDEFSIIFRSGLDVFLANVLWVSHMSFMGLQYME